jgi:mediator of RNA polymerase II transcription subunit 31
VQCLANPVYLNYLATQKYFEKAEFVAYLDYLQYFAEPKYIKFLQCVYTAPSASHPHMCLLRMLCSHPGPTLRALELLQQERFRQDILTPGLANKMQIEGQRNAVPGQRD